MRQPLLAFMNIPLALGLAATASAAAPDAPLETVAREPWRLDPMAVLPLLLLLAWYGRGAWQTRGPRGVVGKADYGPVPVGRRYLARWGETLCFLGGWTALAIAFFSPIDTLSRALFSAHVFQHELILQLAVPLMVLGRPQTVLMQALPRAWARAIPWRLEESRARPVAEALSHPIAAWSIHAFLLGLWLMPAPFEAALRHGSIHAIQHLSLIASAGLFWWSLLYGPQRPVRRSSVARTLFTLALQRLSLGVLIVLSGRLWYPSYLRTTQAWGFAPIEDQQLGALLLWVPAGLGAILMTTALFTGWLRIPGMRPGRTPSDLVRLARPIVSGRPRSDSGAWQH